MTTYQLKSSVANSCAIGLPKLTLFSADAHWAIWTLLLGVALLGNWAERYRWGQALSGAVIAILCGMALSAVGIIPSKAPAYNIVLGYLLPLAIPLLLFDADLSRIRRESGRLLLGFVASAVGTLTGIALAVALIEIPGNEPAVAAALAGAYVGGTLNLVATARAVGLDENTTAALIGAANLTVTAYLVCLFILPRAALLTRRFAEPQILRAEAPDPRKPGLTDSPLLLRALFASLAVCTIGFTLEDLLEIRGAAILIITLLSVAIATHLGDSRSVFRGADILGLALLQVFFAAVGASADIAVLITSGPTLLLFALMILIVHFAITLVGARIFRLSLLEALLASNACAAGAPTAAGMAVAHHRKDLMLPALLCGTLGYAIGNVLGVACYGLLMLIA